MAIESISEVAELRSYLAGPRREGKSIGLVPTMGALHDGHAVLIERARAECDCVVVSIFVNPTQFGEGEDYQEYPRKPSDDLVFCDVRGVDAVFAPPEEEMYPEPLQTSVEPGIDAAGLCGASRPGHFRAVATIVLKLLNVAAPDRAYFGEKDFQQLAVVTRMVRDLNVPVQIVACPTERETDGLAISSRNANLSAEERLVASVLYRALRVARQRVADGDTDPAVALDAARKVLDMEPLARVEYLEIVNPADMQRLAEVDMPARVVGAVWIGQTRLIDNVGCEAPKKKRRRRKA